MSAKAEVIENFDRARDAAMRGGRLAAEGDAVGAYQAVTDIIEHADLAYDALSGEHPEDAHEGPLPGRGDE